MRMLSGMWIVAAALLERSSRICGRAVERQQVHGVIARLPGTSVSRRSIPAHCSASDSPAFHGSCFMERAGDAPAGSRTSPLLPFP